MRKLVLVKAAEGLGVKELVLAAGDETGVAIDAGDQPATVTRYREPEIN